jgi:hypothetical protein
MENWKIGKRIFAVQRKEALSGIFKPVIFYPGMCCLRSLFRGTAPEGYCMRIKPEGITTPLRLWVA